MKPHILYIGGSEWSIQEVPNVEKHRIGKHHRRPGFTLCGLADYPTKSIFIRKGLGRERYEIILHEGLHAVCDEGMFNSTLADLRDDEEAITFLTKMLANYLRQVRDWKVE